MSRKVKATGDGYNLSNIAVETEVVKTESMVAVEVVKTGRKSGKKRVNLNIPEGLSAEDIKSLNIKLRKGGIPLVYCPESHEVTHTRTGLTKAASGASFWLTPDNARKSKLQGR
jgi:hypothetical protein